MPLSTQLNARIEAIAPFHGSLYCGGPFIEVAGKSALGIARWDGQRTPIAVEDLRAETLQDGVQLTWRMAPEAVAGLRTIRIARRGEDAATSAFKTRTEHPAQDFAAQGQGFAWTDAEVRPGTVYAYRLELVEQSGVVTTAGPVQATAAIAVTGLDPIPLVRPSGAVRIAYNVGATGDASLVVFDVRGREIQSLFAGTAEPGRFVASWDRRGRAGAPVPAGVYFVRLRTAGHDHVRRMMIAR